MRFKSFIIVTLVVQLIYVDGCKTNKESSKETKNMVFTEVNTSNPIDSNSLSKASLNGHLQEVIGLLDKGVNVNYKDQDGRTALMYAAFNGHTLIMQKLLERGALVNLRDAYGRTALMLASSGPFPAAVGLLLDHKADPDITDKEEHFSALMYAAAEGQIEIVQILLKNNADPALKDIDGDNALTFAQNNGHKDIVILLKPLLNK